jgi:hypothetical protein
MAPAKNLSNVHCRLPMGMTGKVSHGKATMKTVIAPITA